MRDLGADNRQPCHNGYYPIHEAAKNAASRTMEVLLQWAESRGNSRHQMISFFDAEGNVPLHSAVHSGDFKVNRMKYAEQRSARAGGTDGVKYQPERLRLNFKRRVFMSFARGWSRGRGERFRFSNILSGVLVTEIQSELIGGQQTRRFRDLFVLWNRKLKL